MKRRLSAWLLLAVYVPVLVLSSLHTHGGGGLPVADDCHECVQHHCHGHLSQMADGMHQCVLCEMLTLTYVAAATGFAFVLVPRRRMGYAMLRQSLPYAGQYVAGSRAPPFV